MMENYERNVENWLKQMKWSENPFTLKIDPSLFVGYRDQLRKITNHIREGHKVALVTGSTGSGKTTLMKLIEKELRDEYEILYISKPPRKENMVDVFLSKYRQSIFNKVFGTKIGLHDIHTHINSRLGDKKLLVLMDETHEAEIEVLKWIRTITDQVNNMQTVMAGLSTVEDVLKEKLETLRSRVITHIELINLTREDSRELIRKRIESVGGDGIHPFTESSIKEIYRITGGFPREVLKICDKAVQKAIEENKYVIEKVEYVEKIKKKPKKVRKEEVQEASDEDINEEKQNVRDDEGSVNKDFMTELSYKQRKIIRLLSDESNLFPSDIAEQIGIEKYKSKQHAVRSINNILRRLHKMGYVERKPRGKGFVYSLDLKIKNLMIKS